MSEQLSQSEIEDQAARHLDEMATQIVLNTQREQRLREEIKPHIAAISAHAGANNWWGHSRRSEDVEGVYMNSSGLQIAIYQTGDRGRDILLTIPMEQVRLLAELAGGEHPELEKLRAEVADLRKRIKEAIEWLQDEP